MRDSRISVTRESKYCLITIRPSQGRYSPSGDSSKANARRGVFRVKQNRAIMPLRAMMICAQFWGDKHEAGHQEGGLGSACANAGDDSHAGYRQRDLLLAVMTDPDRR